MNDQLLDYKTISKLEVLFSKVDLYRDVSFEIYKKTDDDKYKIDRSELSRFLETVDFKRESIDAHCVFCGKEYSFDVEFDCDTTKYVDAYGAYCHGIDLGTNAFILLGIYGKSMLPPEIDESGLLNFGLTYLNYVLKCNKKELHTYKMFAVLIIEKGTITLRKIGQFPSKIDIWGFDFDIYKNQLSKFDAYNDFKKAELCMSDKFFAGAYTYLRRVFEKMLNFYCKSIQLPNDKTETKIDACKDKFDSRVRPMLNNLYTILSKAIHQLSDEESESYYVYLRAVIAMQLQHVKEQNDRDEQTKKLKKEIDKIAFDIK